MIVPNDLQEQEAEEPPRAHGAVFSGGPMPKPRVLPHDTELASAAAVLNAGERVAILIGLGARGAAAEVEELADRLGAGVAKALNGREVQPDDLPYVTGSIGLLGTKPSDVMMQGCDTLLMIGSGFPYSEWLPEPGQARRADRPRRAPARHPLHDGGQPRRRRPRHAAGAAAAPRAQAGPRLAGALAGGDRELVGAALEEAEIEADPLNPLRSSTS